MTMNLKFATEPRYIFITIVSIDPKGFAKGAAFIFLNKLSLVSVCVVRISNKNLRRCGTDCDKQLEFIISFFILVILLDYYYCCC